MGRSSKERERERERESGSGVAGKGGERLRDCNVGRREKESGRRHNIERGSVATTSAASEEQSCKERDRRAGESGGRKKMMKIKMKENLLRAVQLQHENERTKKIKVRS